MSRTRAASNGIARRVGHRRVDVSPFDPRESIATTAVILAPFLAVALPFIILLLIPGPAGTRNVRPTAGRGLSETYALRSGYVSHYHLGMGTLVLDLRGWRPTRALKGTVCVDASVDTGRLTVLVPRAFLVVVNAHVTMGSIVMFGHRSSGTHVSSVHRDRNFAIAAPLSETRCVSSRTSSASQTSRGSASRPRLRLRLNATAGTIEIRRAMAKAS